MNEWVNECRPVNDSLSDLGWMLSCGPRLPADELRYLCNALTLLLRLAYGCCIQASHIMVSFARSAHGLDLNTLHSVMTLVLGHVFLVYLESAALILLAVQPWWSAQSH